MTVRLFVRILFGMILCFPSWLMVNTMTPLLKKGHPWKMKHFTLTEWMFMRTFAVKLGDISLYASIAALLLVLNQ